MASIKQVQNRLAALGVSDYTLGWTPNRTAYELDAMAPKGKAFCSTDCHALVVCFYTDPAAARDAMLTDLRDGLRDCGVEDCDVCDVR